VNGAYYPNWRIYKHEPPSCLQLNLISHVFYAFAFVKPNGSVYVRNFTPFLDLNPVHTPNERIG
jgi:GH18 family chitinase